MDISHSVAQHVLLLSANDGGWEVLPPSRHHLGRLQPPGSGTQIRTEIDGFRVRFPAS